VEWFPIGESSLLLVIVLIFELMRLCWWRTLVGEAGSNCVVVEMVRRWVWDVEWSLGGDRSRS
jgi:hypothetical protein